MYRVVIRSIPHISSTDAAALQTTDLLYVCVEFDAVIR